MPENKPSMDTGVGNYLRQAREAKNLSYEQVSKGTKIHGNVLRAMESEDFKTLSAVYARSFLRIYADYLGLDKDDVLQRYEQATGGTTVPKKIIFPGEPKAATGAPLADWAGICVSWLKKVPWMWVIIVIVGYFVLAGTIKFIKSHKNAKPVSANVQAKSKPLKKEIRPAVAAAVSPVAVPAVRIVPIAPEKALEPKPLPPKPKEKIVLIIRAQERVWMQVKVDGKIAFQNVLAKGTAESWQADEKIDLWVANAGVIQVELNGKMLEKIGRRGQTLKNVVVTRYGLTVKR